MIKQDGWIIVNGCFPDFKYYKSIGQDPVNGKAEVIWTKFDSSATMFASAKGARGFADEWDLKNVRILPKRKKVHDEDHKDIST